MATVVFYILAVICITTGILTVSLGNPVTCALSLVACLASLAGLFAQLAAGYAAVLQVLIYAGAIMVLFLFVVMLLNLTKEEAAEPPFGTAGWLKAFTCAAFLIDLHVFVEASIGRRVYYETDPSFGSLRAFGESLFGRYLLAFEMTSVLLTAAVVAVVLITRKDPAPRSEETPPAGSRSDREVEGLSA